MKNLNKQEKEFIAKVAEDSSKLILDVPELRRAYKLLTNNDSTNMRQIRQELYRFHINPPKDGDTVNNITDLSTTTIEPVVEPNDINNKTKTKKGRPKKI